jgi:hypothetical protein
MLLGEYKGFYHVHPEGVTTGRGWLLVLVAKEVIIVTTYEDRLARQRPSLGPSAGKLVTARLFLFCSKWLLQLPFRQRSLGYRE